MCHFILQCCLKGQGTAQPVPFRLRKHTPEHFCEPVCKEPVYLNVSAPNHQCPELLAYAEALCPLLPQRMLAHCNVLEGKPFASTNESMVTETIICPMRTYGNANV